MARQTNARPAATTATSARPPRARAPSVPAFGGWEVAAGGAGAAEAPDYSLDFTNVRAARMQRRTNALSWSSFIGDNAAVILLMKNGQSPAREKDNAAVAVETPDGGCGEEKRQWSRSSSAATTSDGDDDDDDDRERRQRHQHLRRLHSADIDDRQPIEPRRAAPKGRGKFKGYLFGCVSRQWSRGGPCSCTTKNEEDVKLKKPRRSGSHIYYDK